MTAAFGDFERMSLSSRLASTAILTYLVPLIGQIEDTN